MEKIESIGKYNYTSGEFAGMLSECFSSELPGLMAHLMLASEQRILDLTDPLRQLNARRSGVLLLFYLREDNPYLVFIKRPVYNGVHSGQVSFPGGKWEEADESLFHTALREAAEEIGILIDHVRLAGKLTDLYIPPSNFIVSPFVGIYDGVPEFKINKGEVSEILNIPLSDFLVGQDTFKPTELLLPDGSTVKTPGFIFKGHIVWGATAMILNEFLMMWKTIANNR